MKNNQLTVAVLTVSDRSSRGEREDKSGPAIVDYLKENNYVVQDYQIVPDEIDQIQEKIINWSQKNIPLVFTTGGTGFAPRDVTPEATLAVIDRETPGISEYLRYKSFQITPHAVLSRAVSGIKGQSLIINLPGSPKAAKECIQFLLPVLPHALELLVDSPDSESHH